MSWEQNQKEEWDIYKNLNQIKGCDGPQENSLGISWAQPQISICFTFTKRLKFQIWITKINFEFNFAREIYFQFYNKSDSAERKKCTEFK